MHGVTLECADMLTGAQAGERERGRAHWSRRACGSTGVRAGAGRERVRGRLHAGAGERATGHPRARNGPEIMS
ncbi:hypothetical protein CDL15_Pgr023665 [Punica granatum]|nr:hypothetical protein CDL15_Pgr023665 [Punica granatum]